MLGEPVAPLDERLLDTSITASEFIGPQVLAPPPYVAEFPISMQWFRLEE